MALTRTNTAQSPLLKPVVERDYTKGINLTEPDQGSNQTTYTPPPQQGSPGPADPNKAPDQKFNIPQDDTKGFTFDDIPDSPGSDIGAEDHPGGIGVTAASAKTFANFVGNAIQVYLPKMTYNYSRVDIESVIININKGLLAAHWRDVFETINSNTEKSLQISDDVIKMWKSAFKDYLEYKNVQLANPETAFWGATAVLLADQGIRTYQAKKANEEYVRQALAHDSPHLFIKKEPVKPEETTKPSEDGAKTEKSAA